MLIIGSILLLLHQVQGDCSNENKFTTSWGTGANGAFSFKVPESTSSGWIIQVTFDKPVTNLNVWNGQNEQCNGNVCTFSNKNWNKRHSIYIRTGGSLAESFYNIKNGSSIFTLKSSSKNLSNENKQRCLCCLQDKT